MTETAKRLGETQAAKDLKTLVDGGPITDADKLACVKRELAMRRNVYARRVSDGKMKAPVAAREIALMFAILADLEARRAPPAARCDECDNGLNDDWSWCPYCGATKGLPF